LTRKTLRRCRLKQVFNCRHHDVWYDRLSEHNGRSRFARAVRHVEVQERRNHNDRNVCGQWFCTERLEHHEPICLRDRHFHHHDVGEAMTRDGDCIVAVCHGVHGGAHVFKEHRVQQSRVIVRLDEQYARDALCTGIRETAS
jgi:hypothetical protein